MYKIVGSPILELLKMRNARIIYDKSDNDILWNCRALCRGSIS
jgi:hypothetical protein